MRVYEMFAKVYELSVVGFVKSHQGLSFSYIGVLGFLENPIFKLFISIS